MDDISEFDEVMVIYSNNSKSFYCGDKQWDKQLRKAKFYKSYAFAKKRADSCFDDVDIYTVQMRLCNKVDY